MFRAWRFDLPETATDGDNRLLVLIRSVRARLRAQPPHDYVSLFDANRIFLRKTQCQFGWDCIPDLPSTGIWKSCSLVLPDEREIRDVRIETRVDGRVSFFVEVDLPPLRSELDGIRERYRPEELGLELRIGIQQPDGTSVAQATVAVSGGASYATLSVARPGFGGPTATGSPSSIRTASCSPTGSAWWTSGREGSGSARSGSARIRREAASSGSASR